MEGIQDKNNHYPGGKAVVAAAVATLCLAACSMNSDPTKLETEKSSEVATFNEQGNRIAIAIANQLDENSSAIAHNTDGAWRLTTGESHTAAYAIFKEDGNELILGASTPTDTSETYSWVTVTLAPSAQMAADLRAAERSESAPDTHVFTDPIRATGDNGPIIKSFSGIADGQRQAETGAYFLALKDPHDPQLVHAIAVDGSQPPTNKQPTLPYDKATASRIAKGIDQALNQIVG